VEWLKRKAWVGVYGALLTAGAYLTADLVNLFVGRQLEASIRVENRPALPVSRPPLPVDPDAYRRIIEGNLFNPALRGSLAPAALVPDAPPPPLNLPLTLIGTGEREGGASLAIIEDRSTHEQGVYHIHDVVKDGAVLTKVERNLVVLRLGTQEQVISLYSDGTDEVASLSPGSPLPSESQPAQNTGIRQVQPNRWLLDKQEVTAALENLPQLLTKARVVPNFTDGKPDGFKIFSIVPDSLYAKIGLQNGDVLQQINGVEIKNPENFMRVFQQLKDEPNIAIDLVRNNQRESFAYEIR